MRCTTQSWQRTRDQRAAARRPARAAPNPPPGGPGGASGPSSPASTANRSTAPDATSHSTCGPSRSRRLNPAQSTRGAQRAERPEDEVALSLVHGRHLTAPDQRRVRATVRDQFLVPSAFHYGAVLEYDDLVAVPHGAEPVRDHHAGTAAPAQAVHDHQLGLRVQGAGHFRRGRGCWAGEPGPSRSPGAGALPAGEVPAVLLDAAADAARAAHHHVVQRGVPQGVHHRVVRDRRIPQRHALSRTEPSKRNTSWSTKETEDASAPRAECLLQPLPVDAGSRRPTGRTAPRSAGTRWTCRCPSRRPGATCRPGPTVEVEAGEQGLVERVVAEGDVLQLHVAVQPAGWSRCRRGGRRAGRRGSSPRPSAGPRRRRSPGCGPATPFRRVSGAVKRTTSAWKATSRPMEMCPSTARMPPIHRISPLLRGGEGRRDHAQPGARHPEPLLLLQGGGVLPRPLAG